VIEEIPEPDVSSATDLVGPSLEDPKLTAGNHRLLGKTTLGTSPSTS